MSSCNGCPQTEREGETYTDGNGKLRVVVFKVCQNPFCENYKKLRCKTEGDDMPQTYMPPMYLPMRKP